MSNTSKKHGRRFSLLSFGSSSHSRHASETLVSQITSTPSSPSPSQPRVLKTSASTEELGARNTVSRRRSKLVRGPRRKFGSLFGEKSIQGSDSTEPSVAAPATVQEEDESGSRPNSLLPPPEDKPQQSTLTLGTLSPSRPTTPGPVILSPHEIPLPVSPPPSPKQNASPVLETPRDEQPPMSAVTRLSTDYETASLAHLAAKLEERISLDLLDLPASQPQEDAPALPKGRQRRKSLDFKALTSATNINRHSGSLGRSKTLFTRQRTGLAGQENRQSEDLSRARAQMSESQRQVHVRRAQKIAKVFGDDPPPELIHIAANDFAALKPYQRDSLITLLSLDVSLNSTSIELEHSPSGLKPPESPFADRPPSTTPSQDSDGAIRIATSSNNDTEHDTFTMRRKRAAKLSRFFGVGNLSTSLLKPQQLDISQEPQEPPSPIRSAGVDVRLVQPGRRRWGFLLDGQPPKEADMQDVLQQLRGLKSS